MHRYLFIAALAMAGGYAWGFSDASGDWLSQFQAIYGGAVQ